MSLNTVNNEMTGIIGSVKGIMIHDLAGSPLFSKLYDESIQNKQYEERLFARVRTHKSKDDLFRLDQTLVVHKFTNELHFYVIGHTSENPLLLDSVLDCLVDVATTLLSKTLEKQSFLKKRAQIMSAINEICDNGMILEFDGDLVLERVSSKDDFSEQTMTQRLQSATEQFKFPWVRS